MITAMSFRKMSLFLTVIVGAYSLSAACTYQLPTVVTGDGGAGMGGDMSPTSASVGAGNTGMGGNAGAGGMPLDWWNPAWKRRVRITLGNSGGEALSGFPVMVRLDKSRIEYADTAPMGADLRFVDDDGQTILAHEMDRWTPSGASFVWVRVPTIDATDTDHIWLYYGNSGVKDEQNATALWEGFLGVYHLSPIAGMSLQVTDSTGTSHGTWDNNQIGGFGPGKINQAVSLDGVHFIHIGDNGNVAADPGEARTVEAWVKASNVQNQAIVYEEGQCVGWSLGMNASSEYVGTFITDSIDPPCDPGTTEYEVTASAMAGTWHYLTLVVDRPGLEMRLFVDGTLMTVTNIDNTDIADGNGVFRIGSDHNGGEGTFVGAIDEVRVSSSARSAGWIAAQHKSMTDKFLGFTFD